ncbi:MAG: hypothetical protein HY718_08655 [Planctomycetes bacterium]|nr:hypothetical protein [Planctomycetota bacterium]
MRFVVSQEKEERFMKKLLVFAVCAMAGSAMAVVPAAFDLVPDTVDLLPGQGVDVMILGVGDGAIAGMSLFLEAQAPLSIDTLGIDNVGGVFTFPGTSTGESIFTNALTPEIVTVPQLAVGYVTTSAASMNVASGALLAKMHISVPQGTPLGEYYVTTNGPALGVPSDFVDPAQQDTMIVRVIPEPITALLLLAGVPFLRRRHA